MGQIVNRTLTHFKAVKVQQNDLKKKALLQWPRTPFYHGIKRALHKQIPASLSKPNHQR